MAAMLIKILTPVKHSAAEGKQRERMLINKCECKFRQLWETEEVLRRAPAKYLEFKMKPIYSKKEKLHNVR